jgi:hypothetical protein
MTPTGWLTPTDPNPAAFNCIVTGDARLPEAAYPFVRDTLDKLLAQHLSSVCIAYVWRTRGTDHLAARYARERKLRFDFISDRSAEAIRKLSTDMLIVFDGGEQESEELLTQARIVGITVHVVEARAFVTPAHL